MASKSITNINQIKILRGEVFHTFCVLIKYDQNFNAYCFYQNFNFNLTDSSKVSMVWIPFNTQSKCNFEKKNSQLFTDHIMIPSCMLCTFVTDISTHCGVVYGSYISMGKCGKKRCFIAQNGCCYKTEPSIYQMTSAQLLVANKSDSDHAGSGACTGKWPEWLDMSARRRQISSK